MRSGIRRSAILAAACWMLAGRAGLAQSGRSWMNGMVFGASETDGLPNATVELVGDEGTLRLRAVVLRTVTGSDGKYAFTFVPYGAYRFRVSAGGFETYEIRLYVASDMLTEVHVRLKPVGTE